MATNTDPYNSWANGFNVASTRLDDKLNQSFSRHEYFINNIESRIHNYKNEVLRLNDRITEFDGIIQNLNKTIEELTKRVAELEDPRNIVPVI